jgi:serine protease
MSRLSRLLSVVCLGAAATVASFAAEHNPIRPVPHPTASADYARVIVKLRERAHALSVSRATPTDRVRAAGTFGSRLHLALADGRALGPRTQVLTARGISSSDLAARLAKDPDVEWAVVSHRRYPQMVPSDPLFPNNQTATTPIVGQWYLRVPNAADNVGAVSAIDAEGAWDVTTGTAAVVIADLDTGVTNHPDIAGAFLPNTSNTTWPPYGYDFIGYSSSDGAGAIPTANDGNGADPDPSDPGDWIDANDQTHSYFDAADCPIEDSSWHGTQTAGILSAQMNNGQGMAGIAPGAKLLPVRVLGKCGGWDDDIIAAMMWAAGISVPDIPDNVHPARVLNMSLGGTCDPTQPDSCTCPSSYADAFSSLAAKNVVAVVAAGNDSGLPLGVPAVCTGAITVAALRHAGDKVGFSDIGPNVALSAPGGNCVNTGDNEPCLYPILTAFDTGLTSPVSSTYTTSYLSPSLGTSFATPMVSATAALMLSVTPALTSAQVKQILQRTSTVFPTTGGTDGTPVCTAPNASQPQDECYCTTTTCGAGMLNASAAVHAAALLASPQAIITSQSNTVMPGASLVLNGGSSTASAGQTVTNYTWQITQGTSVASLSSSTGASVTLTGVAAGQATVQLTITDSAGITASTQAEITVTAPASDSGGGAANPLWLLGLALAALALAPRRARR